MMNYGDIYGIALDSVQAARLNDLTKAVKAAGLPMLYATDGQGKAAKVGIHLFIPFRNWSWFATEFDEKTGTCFGLVAGLETELGYFNLAELATTPVWVDTKWQPMTVGEVMDRLRA